MKGIYFASFYFRVCDLTCKIRKNKNPMKISTYTVVHGSHYMHLLFMSDCACVRLLTCFSERTTFRGMDVIVQCMYWPSEKQDLCTGQQKKQYFVYQGWMLGHPLNPTIKFQYPIEHSWVCPCLAPSKLFSLQF